LRFDAAFPEAAVRQGRLGVLLCRLQVRPHLGLGVDPVAANQLVARVIQNEGMTQKRQCHARESGHPDLAVRAGALDSRLRGNDSTLKNLILNNNRILEHSVSQCCMYAPKILELLDLFSLYMTHSDTYNYPAKRARTVPNDA